MKYKSRYFLGALTFMVTIALFGLAVMFLWNELLHGIFGLPAINYWQAAGLLVLARILFGGIGGGFFHIFARRNPFHDKWQGMSRAEQQIFLKKHHHGFHDHSYNYHDAGDNDAGKDGETKKD
jgi:hypothetical protein